MERATPLGVEEPEAESQIRNWKLEENFALQNFGPRSARLLEPICSSQVEAIEWRPPRFDLAELARLRWKETWGVKRLAEHFGKTENAIKLHIYKLRIKGSMVEEKC